MPGRRKKRSLDRSVEVLRSTNILFVGIEGGSYKSKEALYFDMFKGSNIKVQVRIYPCEEHKSAPIHVLNHLKNRLKEEVLQEGDEAWLLIDKDRYQHHLPEVASMCIDADISLALSNPCFEYWLLLHHNKPNQLFDECKEVKKELAIILSKIDTSESFESIYWDKVDVAISRARDLDNSADRWPQQNGSRVYRLVERIRAF